MSKKRMRDVLADSLLKSGEYRYLTPEEIKKVQNSLLDALKDILVVQKELDSRIYLVGGSLLGAVRHKGFIPWDDDLDLGVMRSDYFTFIEELERRFPDKYMVLSPNYKEGSQTFYGRVYIKDVVKTSPSNEGLNYPQNLFIDLFIIDFAPNNKILRQIKGIYINSLRFIGSSVFRYTYSTKERTELHSQTRKAELLYKMRLLIGFLFSFRSYKKWFNLFDTRVQGKTSNYVTLASGRKFYLGEVLEQEIFEEIKHIKFEDILAPIPGNSHKYLENLYGDYMVIPPKEKRERHIVKELSFNCNTKQKEEFK